MLADLKEMGFKVVVSQDPVISQANKKQWEEADRLGYFVKDSTNGKSYDMPWPWGGNCGVVDFTLPAVADRSEERRVGKECRSRWSPYH